ncbi:hypothetical protein GMRT_10276 [Giardia muris]|uniref:Uncharacterized protein n=1 Tax=Giardia muris TaxID=5742 RepID=A0A4Z1SU41_GIAMU|nr:hypothetical protein GMRT_10276 [Giardia muris]|eukprot:TNJ29432.1 hypothetical protein GMRT_10276 [Giardia muris]
MPQASTLGCKLSQLHALTETRAVTHEDIDKIARPEEARRKASSRLLEEGEASTFRPMRAAMCAVTTYARETAISILPTWEPPTLEEAMAHIGLTDFMRALSLTYVKDPSLGTIHAHKTIMDGFIRDQRTRAPCDPHVLQTPSAEHGDHPISTLGEDQLKTLSVKGRVIYYTFTVEDWNFNELHYQECLYEYTNAPSSWLVPLDASELDPHAGCAIPFPWFDIYPRFLVLLTLASLNVRLSERMYAFFLSPRVVDMVEVLFWLIHGIVFAPTQTSTPSSEVMKNLFRDKYRPELFEPSNLPEGLEEDVYEDVATETMGGLISSKMMSMSVTQSTSHHATQPIIGADGRLRRRVLRLPPHLRPMQHNLSSQEYLRNRFADDFAAIERNWLGCRSVEKERISELLPYIICSATIRGLFRIFPAYAQTFSPKFCISVYENIIYYLTGIHAYTDFIQDLRKRYFRTESYHVSSLLSYFRPGTETYIGAHLIDGQLDIQPTSAYSTYNSMRKLLAGRYRDLTRNLVLDTLLHDIQVAKEEAKLNSYNSEMQMKNLEFRPIEYDLVLFPEVTKPSPINFGVSQSMSRNTFSLNTSKASSPRRSDSIKSTIIPTSPTITDFGRKSITQVDLFTNMSVSATPKNSVALGAHQLEVEQVVDTTLKAMSPTKPPMAPEPFVIKDNRAKVLRATLPQLDSVYDTVRRVKGVVSLPELKRPVRARSPVNSEVDSEVALERARAFGVVPLEPVPDVKDTLSQNVINEVLEATKEETSASTHAQLVETLIAKCHHGASSVSIDNTFLIRLDPKLQPSTKPTIEGVIGNEIVTSNDIVLVENDETYTNHVNTALQDAIHQPQRKASLSPHPKAPSPNRQVSKTVRHAEEVISMLPRTSDITHKDTIEKLLGNPLGTSGQKISTVRITPVMERYLTITGAPSPVDFSTYIRDTTYIDPTLGKSDTRRRVENHHAGKLTPVRGVAVDREIGVVRRTRNDPWSRKDVIDKAATDMQVLEGSSPDPSSSPELSQRQSPNNFHLQYKEAKQRLHSQALECEKKHKAEMAELEVQKQLFLNRNLKGQAMRAAALARALAEGESQDKKDGETTFLSYFSRGTTTSAFLEFKAALKKDIDDIEHADHLARRILAREEYHKHHMNGVPSVPVEDNKRRQNNPILRREGVKRSSTAGAESCQDVDRDRERERFGSEFTHSEIEHDSELSLHASRHSPSPILRRRESVSLSTL